MNVIIQQLDVYLEAERRIDEVRARNRTNPDGYVVTLGDGTEEEHDVNVATRDEFNRLWRQAGGWLATRGVNIRWEQLD